MKSRKRIARLQVWSFAALLAPLAGLFCWGINISFLDILGYLLYMGMPVISLSLSFFLRNHRETMTKAYGHVYMGLTAFFCLIFYGIPLCLFFQSKLEYNFVGTLLSFVLYGLLVYILSRAHLGPLRRVFAATDLNGTFATPGQHNSAKQQKQTSSNPAGTDGFIEKRPPTQPSQQVTKEPIAFPLQPAWYMTAKRYWEHGQTKSNVTPSEPVSRYYNRKAFPYEQQPPAFLRQRTYHEQLKWIHGEISHFNKKTLPLQLNAIKESLLPLKEHNLLASSYVRLEGIFSTIDSFCLAAHDEVNAFPMLYLKKLRLCHDDKDYQNAWMVINQQLTDCLSRTRQKIDFLSSIKGTCYWLARDTQQSAAKDAKCIAVQLHEQAQILAAHLKLTIDQLPHRIQSKEVISAAITLDTLFSSAGPEAEAEAYAKEVVLECKRSRGIPEEEHVLGAVHWAESAKKWYLKEYYNIEWKTMEELYPGICFD